MSSPEVQPSDARIAHLFQQAIAHLGSNDLVSADADHPLIWIELDGQAAWNESGQQAFLSPFVPTGPTPFEVASPAAVERQARVSWDENAAISFEPAGSDWKLSAAIVYGRSNRHQFLDQLTQSTYVGVYRAYQDITASSSESHAILDFQAGRDFGLGRGVSSTINLGVRFANSTQEPIQPSDRSHRTRTILSLIPDSMRPSMQNGASLAWGRLFRGMRPLPWRATRGMGRSTLIGELTPLSCSADKKCAAIITQQAFNASPITAILRMFNTTPRLRTAAGASPFPISAVMLPCRGARTTPRSASVIAPICSSARWMAASMRRRKRTVASMAPMHPSASG